MVDHLQRGRECYARLSWNDAYDSLVRADQTAPLRAEDLERLATSSYLIGRDLDFQRLHERLHHAHVEENHPSGAARCCFWLGLSFLFQGEAGQANAWIARGRRLIEKLDCAERGYLLVLVAEQELRRGNIESAQAMAVEAIAIGEGFADPDLAAAARHLYGRTLIQQGEVLIGLERLDETMLSVVAGEVSPIMTGLLYCSVLAACIEVYALGRAQEWTAAFVRTCEQQPEMIAFTDICLIHRAEVLQLCGAWPDALSEASRVCDRCVRCDRKPPGAALYQQAEIHRLRGEFEPAEETYRAASERGYDPQPGLALLRLAQGRIDPAVAAVSRLMSATRNRLRRAGLLPAHFEIALAAGDLCKAREACVELQQLAELFGIDVLRATAAQVHGALALAEGNACASLDPLRSAFEIWNQLDVPYEAARVRVLIGRACGALGDHETARLEFTAARLRFERLGARPDLARLAALEASVESPRDHPLTARELDVLRLVSTGSTNKAIAAQLCLSGRTIDRHVSNILRKLEVPSRAAATAYAYDHKLL